MSGTVLIDLSDTGDLQNFLDVAGSHDTAFNANGIVSSGGFDAYPWANTFKDVDEKKRRAPSALLTEEWLKVIETCHGRNDLATAHDVLGTWKLPDDTDAGTLTAGGTQFDGHVWCKRSWWKHVARQRYCIERAIQSPNLWEFIGSHTGTGTISGGTFSGSGTGTLTGGLTGSYSITISGTVSAGPNGSFTGTISGGLTGTFTGTITAGVVSITWTITSPTGITLTPISNTFVVGGGGTTFSFSGSFSGEPPLDSLAESYIGTAGAPTVGWTTTPDLDAIGRGKMYWSNGWRKMLFPWSPIITQYNLTANGCVFEHRLDSRDGSEPESNITYLPNALFPTPYYYDSGFSLPSSASGVAGHVHRDDGGGQTVESWYYFAIDATAFLCSIGSTITRPKSSLRNVFGWGSGDDTPIARLKLTGEEGSGHACHLWFLWYDNQSLSTIPQISGSGSLDTQWLIPDDFETRAFDLGALSTGAETSIDLTPALDELWDARSISKGRRVPLFIIGPPWEHDSGNWGTYGFVKGATQTDDAATAGVNHLIPWNVHVSSAWDLSIGTSMYPFRMGG